MRIGFFGDSYCAQQHLFYTQYQKNNHDTYIKKLSDHYNAEICSLGQNGSSIWDTILIQFKKFENNLPDVCIFSWTNSGRIFNRKVRNINTSSALSEQTEDKEIWDAAKKYYYYLSDIEKEQNEYLSAIYYFDNVILNKLNKNIKIIHMWSFGDINYDLKNYHNPNNIRYIYKWQSGIEIRPALYSISMKNCFDEKINYRDWRPNHLDGDKKNNLVFNWIKYAIDNYEPGKILNFTDDVDNFGNDDE